MTQPWSVNPNDPFQVPNNAGPNDSAIILTNADMPPCMQPFYGAGIFWRPTNSQTGFLNSDSPVYFIAVSSLPTNPVGTIHQGAVLYDPVLGYCDYRVFRQVVMNNTAGVLTYGETLGVDTAPYTRTAQVWNFVDSQFLDTTIDLTNGTDSNAGYVTYGPQKASSTGITGLPAAPASTAVAGTLVNINTLRTTDVIQITGSFDMERIAAGGGTAIGLLLVDGVAEVEQVPLSLGTIGNRATVCGPWSITGLAPGAHTFQLAVQSTGAAGVWRALNPHTRLTLHVHY
jgi:hypothetical protein